MPHALAFLNSHVNALATVLSSFRLRVFIIIIYTGMHEHRRFPSKFSILILNLSAIPDIRHEVATFFTKTKRDKFLLFQLVIVNIIYL